MKEILMNNVEKKERANSTSSLSTHDYIWAPLKSGLFGFAIFFTILLAVKLFSYAIGTYNYFAIELTDLQLSSIGFVLLFLIRELENFKEKED
ncbi:MAG: hypothetical protein L3J41_07795 [Melioribacteraceae bacterium]|nr:hypothetical protein [Melioribacteraceae bacterium]